jgi:hypothetical protein
MTAGGGGSGGGGGTGSGGERGLVSRAGDFITRNPELLLMGGLAASQLLAGQDQNAPTAAVRDAIPAYNAARDAEKERWKRIPFRPYNRNQKYARPGGVSGDQSRAMGGERRYFAEGGGIGMPEEEQLGAIGNAVRHPNGYLQGDGDGMSDDIAATAYGEDGTRPVNVADGEYVIAADVVSGLGNGSSEAGVRFLDDLCARVRASRSGGEQPEPIDPAAMLEG